MTFRDEIRETVTPWKFGGSRGAAMVYLLSLESGEDEWTGDTDWHGYYARFGRRIMQIDSMGFVDVFRYPSESEASAVFAQIDADYEAVE